MSEEKKEEKIAQPVGEDKGAPSASPMEPKNEEPSPQAAPAPEQPKPKEEPKSTPRAKKEKPSNCAACNKSIRKKRWYYRNGKYYCAKRCWSQAAKKDKQKEPEADKK